MRFFYWRKLMNTHIQCPCGHNVIKHDGRSQIPKTVKCSACGRYVRYNPIEKTVKVVSEPERKMSSGKRFF